MMWWSPLPCCTTFPGSTTRASFVQAAAACLNPAGLLLLSNWRFAQHPRMRRKIVPWERVGLTADSLESGDYLLDWKAEGEGFRYAHQLDEEEIAGLATAAGLRVIEQFRADGREGDLSLYSVLAW